MERRAFLVATAAAAILRKLPASTFQLGTIYPSTATAELARLEGLNRRWSSVDYQWQQVRNYARGYSVSMEMIEDDLCGGPQS